MRRQAILLIAAVAAALLASAGVVLAQAPETEPTSSQERAEPAPSPQPRDARDAVIPGRYIVVLEGGAEEANAQGSRQDPEQVASAMAQENEVEEVTHTYESALRGFAARIPQGQLDDVRSDPRVAFVSEDREVHATAQTLPTGVNRVDADLSSTQAGNGSGAVSADVAILDTGINTGHPDLNVVGGNDCSTDGKRTFSDDNGHGSHVAGTAAAEDNAAGVVGVAPGARLWAVKVLKADGGGSWSDIICGVDWVSRNAGTIEVANMSLGGFVGPGADDGNCGNSNNDALHRAICNSVNNAGVTYVVAAGNETDDATQYVPAAYTEVITVSSLADYDGRPGGFGAQNCFQDEAWDDDFGWHSNYAVGSFNIDLAAPGVCIKSTWKAVKKGRPGHRRTVHGYKTISGTSMASPHVAGAAALYESRNPGVSPAQVRSALRSPANVEPLGAGHTDFFGLHPEPVMLARNF